MMTTATAYNDGRLQLRPTTTAVVAYNDGQQQQQPTTVAAAAYIDGSREGDRCKGQGAYAQAGGDKGAHHGINKGQSR